MQSFKKLCLRLYYLFAIKLIFTSTFSNASLLSEHELHQKCKAVFSNTPTSCMEGFHLKSDNKTCAPNDPSWSLICATKQSILSLQGNGDNITSFQRPNYIIQDSNDNNFVFITSDVRNRDVFWTNVAAGDEGVYKSSINNDKSGHTDIIVDTSLFLPMGIAFDWITGNLYFADKRWCLIAVCTLNPTRCAVVIKEASDSRISDIALHPNKGIMFWTDEGIKETIKKANMDGSNATTIVSTHLSSPTGITVDEANSRVYWTDFAYNIIESSRFDGSDRRTTTRCTDPFGIEIFGDFVFWGTIKDSEIYAIHKYGGRVTTVKDVEKIRGLNVMHITKQSMLRKNSCETGNCSHICALAATKAQCLCPVGMILTNENFCLDNVEIPKLLLVQHNKLLIAPVNAIGKDVFEQTNVPPEIKAIDALVYNPINDTVIISDNVSKKIVEYKMGTNNFTVLVDNDLFDVTMIAFDPVGENLFWYDSKKQTIEVFSMATGARIVLITDCENVHDILFVADHGRLYYSISAQTGNDEEIHKIALNETAKHTLIHSYGNQEPRPMQLTFDRARNTIDGTSWNATHVFMSSVYFTSDIKYHWKTGDSRRIYDAVHINNQLLWVDNTYKIKVLTMFDDDETILQFIKINYSTIGNMTPGSPRKILTAMDRNISHLNKLRSKHQCSTNNLNRKTCSHICLPANFVTYWGKCLCPTDLSLDGDGKTCIKQEQTSTIRYENHRTDLSEDKIIDEAENLDDFQNNGLAISTTVSNFGSKENNLKSLRQYKGNGADIAPFYSMFIAIFVIYVFFLS